MQDNAPALTIHSSPAARSAFIRANTTALPVSNIPEIFLYQADEAHALWHRTEEELGELGLPPPYWAFAWIGGQGLARYILDNPLRVAGRRVLDIASGSGLVGITAYLAGAAKVTCQDVDPFSHCAIRLNAALNDVSVQVCPDDLAGKSGFPSSEVILAGDIYYDRQMVESVHQWLRTCQQRGCTVLVGDPGRSYFPDAEFVQLAEYELHTNRYLEDSEYKYCRVWALRKQKDFADHCMPKVL